MAWLRTLHRKLATLRRLPGERRRGIARAWIVLTLIHLALQRLPYGALRKRLKTAVDTPSPPAQAQDATRRCRRLAADVAIAARNHFLPVSCLGRSLALHALCRRAGYAAQLRIGICRTSDCLRGHAWVEAEGEILNDTDAVTRTYAVLERIPSHRPTFFSAV